MIFKSKTSSLGLSLALLFFCCAANAQEQPPAARPALKADSNDSPEDVQVKIEKNPAVLNALEMPRKTPADYFQAVQWLIDLDRQSLAKPILDELTKLPLTDAQRAELVEKFGSLSMLKLARARDLEPTGGAFAEACMAAASAATNNPQRIGMLVKQLTDASPENRAIAQHDLAAAGQKGATATLEAFARETDPNRRASLAAGVIATHPLADGPLLAMLDTRDPVLRADVADLLRQLKVPQAAPFLHTDDSAAERGLSSAIASYGRGTPVFAADATNRVELWQWNDATKELSSVRLPADEARIFWISKLARRLSQIRPQNPEYQRRMMALAWEAGALSSPTRAAYSPPAAPADTRLLNEILAESLTENLPHAAVTAANALAQSGNQLVLLTGNGNPSPLAAALTSPNRSVRFAALRAIMALDPTSPYPGSSRVPEALAWFAASTAERRALVAMPTLEAASDLAGHLAAQGFDAEATNHGGDAVAMAREMSDIEAIFVDMNIILPGIREVLYQLRTNPTTGEVPIAILAGEGRLEAAQKLAAEHQRVIAVPRPHSDEVVASTVKALADLAAPDAISAKERVAQAAQARAWLAKLESGGRPFYVFRRTARLDISQPRSGTPPSPPK